MQEYDPDFLTLRTKLREILQVILTPSSPSFSFSV
jgi:hypothetical protein